nr:protein ABIL1-like isoform X2 [Ipomoea batatas]
MAVLLPSSEVSLFSAGRRPAGIFSKLRNFHKVAITNNGKEIVGARISSSVKDMEEAARDLSLGFNLGLCDCFSAMAEPATAFPSIKPSKEEEQKQDYYLNMGYAIRTIREEFPALFYRELSFDIYRDDIVFKDPVNTFVGIENYKSIFWALRFHGRMFFRALWIDIVSVWQPVDSMIMVRWTVHGIPRVPWESRGRFDGTSEYKLDKTGKIYEHKNSCIFGEMAVEQTEPENPTTMLDETEQNKSFIKALQTSIEQQSLDAFNDELKLSLRICPVKQEWSKLARSIQRQSSTTIFKNKNSTFLFQCTCSQTLMASHPGAIELERRLQVRNMLSADADKSIKAKSPAVSLWHCHAGPASKLLAMRTLGINDASGAINLYDSPCRIPRAEDKKSENRVKEDNPRNPECNKLWESQNGSPSLGLRVLQFAKSSLIEIIVLLLSYDFSKAYTLARNVIHSLLERREHDVYFMDGQDAVTVVLPFQTLSALVLHYALLVLQAWLLPFESETDESPIAARRSRVARQQAGGEDQISVGVLLLLVLVFQDFAALVQLGEKSEGIPSVSAGFKNSVKELVDWTVGIMAAAVFALVRAFILLIIFAQEITVPLVIDNLKDYAVRAFVNAVDHLGTVSYKLTDILEQQSLDVSMMELKVSCLDQRVLTCQTYTDHEGLRQQQLLATIPRLHKHYTLPAPGICPVNKNVQTSSLIQRSPRPHIQTRQHLFVSGAPAAKTLSWHLSSGAKSKLKKASVSDETGKSSGRTSDADKSIKAKSPARPLALHAGPASSVAMRTLGITRRDAFGGYKPMTPCRIPGNTQLKTARAPIRTKSAISAFFVKQKTRKVKTRVKEDNPRNPRMQQGFLNLLTWSNIH